MIKEFDEETVWIPLPDIGVNVAVVNLYGRRNLVRENYMVVASAENKGGHFIFETHEPLTVKDRMVAFAALSLAIEEGRP